MGIHTDSSLRASIYAALAGGNAPNGSIDDFDVEAIAEEVHQATGSWDLGEIGDREFWEIVRKHDKTQQPTVAIHVKLVCPLCKGETYVRHNGFDQAQFELDWAETWGKHSPACRAIASMPMPPKVSATIASA